MKLEESLLCESGSKKTVLNLVVGMPVFLKGEDYSLSMGCMPLCRERLYHQVTPLLLLHCCGKMIHLEMDLYRDRGGRVFHLDGSGGKGEEWHSGNPGWVASEGVGETGNLFVAEKAYVRRRNSLCGEEMILEWEMPRKTPEGWRSRVFLRLPSAQMCRVGEVLPCPSPVKSLLGGVNCMIALLKTLRVEEDAVFYFTAEDADKGNLEEVYEIPIAGERFPIN